MDAVFIELPPFERVRLDYLSDDDYRTLQTALMNNPTVGDVIQQTGGLRKINPFAAENIESSPSVP